ncbi:MAG: ATP--guanido phosphotransferase [Oscillospiraceae bacterium]|jgi:protein arginine kinase|nr:ATP--guanido phosphotransferase [Oscillospiraceae bacterium]
MTNNSIVSFRVRLARNIRGRAFPDRMEPRARQELVGALAQTLTSAAGGSFTYLPLDKTNRGAAAALRERRLISPEFSAEDAPHGAVLSGAGPGAEDDPRVSVMLCEEDHLRIQAFGSDLARCLQTAQNVETLIDETHPLAFDETLGFLTACPTNLGTGLRASALMHLPALTETQSMRRLIQQAGASGLAVRGFYGEGTQAAWGYYQISNAVTLGLTEQEIITALAEVTSQIADFEQRARQAQYKNDPVGLADRVWRAVGILRNARRITTQEAMDCLAAVRMGISLDLLPGYDTPLADRLSQEIWPGLLSEAKGPFSSQAERDEVRAAMLREALMETAPGVCQM